MKKTTISFTEKQLEILWIVFQEAEDAQIDTVQEKRYIKMISKLATSIHKQILKRAKVISDGNGKKPNEN